MEAAARLSLPVNRHDQTPGDTRPSSLGPTVGRPVTRAGRWAGLKPMRGRPTRIDPALLRGAGRRAGERSRLKGHADFLKRHEQSSRDEFLYAVPLLAFP